MTIIPLWVKGLAVAVLLALVFGAGWIVRGWRADAVDSKAVATQATHTVAIVERQAAVTAKSDASAAATAARAQIVYRTITKEVTKYVSTHPVSCPLPDGWVQLHNAAAIGAIPNPAGTADATSRAAANTQ